MTGAIGTLQQGLAQFALHALWQVPLLAGAAWCAIRLGRPHVRVAYASWVGTLLLCVAMPLVATMAARRAAFKTQRALQDSSITYEARAYEGDLPALERAPAWKRLLHRHLNGRDGLQPFAFALSQRAARAISCGYLLALLFFSAQLIAAWRRTRALVATGAADALPEAIQRALEEQCQQLCLPTPQAHMHREIAGPALAGVVHPVLLLPAACTQEMSTAEIDAVLAHELAHLRRRDPLVHAMCSLLLVPVAFHPAAMWVAQCVRQTREMACDADAAQHVGSSTAYAHALLHVAERADHRSPRTRGAGFFSNGLFGAGLGLFDGSLELFNRNSAMEERMQMLMKSNRSNAQRGSALRLTACVSLAAVAVLAAGMLQVQPALAGERAVQQSAAATPQAAQPAQSPAQDREPRLLSGEHARQQLQHARGQLAEAQRNATTDEDRRKIATARDMMAVAESALAPAGEHRSTNVNVNVHTNVDLSKLQVQLDAMKLPDMATMNAQREAAARVQAQMATPEWQARMRRAQESAEKVRIQMQSPEWQAQMLARQQQALDRGHAQMQSPEFRQHIEDAMKLSREVVRQTAIARDQQAMGMEDLRSADAARRLSEEARQIARLDMPKLPVAAQQPRPAKIAPGVMAGNILHQEPPAYPADAKEKKIQGEVLLHAVISETGVVEQLAVVTSPDASLSRSALDAVSHWTYKPYLLNGEPTAVDTTITVHYSLVP